MKTFLFHTYYRFALWINNKYDRMSDAMGSVINTTEGNVMVAESKRITAERRAFINARLNELGGNDNA